MKVSEVIVKDLMEYANEYSTDPEVIKTFNTILLACKSYIKHYTGLTIDQIDTKEDLTIALMVLANELYDNRTFTVKDDKVNPVIKTILDMHCINLL